MKRLMTLTILALGTLGATAALAHCPPNPSGVVDGLYHKYLGRHPDAVGLNLYVADLQRGTPVDQVEASILGSPEYFRRNGSSPDGFVVGLFRDVLGQAPCPHDMKVWLGRTLHSPDRVSVALRFLREMRPTVVVQSAPVVTPVTVTQPVVVPAPRVTVVQPALVPVYVPPTFSFRHAPSGISVHFRIR